MRRPLPPEYPGYEYEQAGYADQEYEPEQEYESEKAPLVWRGVTFTIILMVLLLGIFITLVSQVSLAKTQSVANANAGNTANLYPPPTVVGIAAYVFDADTGKTLYAKDSDEKLAMASCTKVMTALLAVEHGKLDQVITVGADAHALVGPDSSYMGLDVGEKLTLRDLLYGLIMPSGNDAAIAIADAIGGNEVHFVQMMNSRAVELGLTHTHYSNPHGLDAPNHYTSARDLAVLSAIAIKNPTLRTIMSATSYKIPKTTTHKAYNLTTGNDLLPGRGAAYPGAIGVKPGYTGNAGYCQSFAAIRDGHLIVGAVMRDPSWQVRQVDMTTLLNWGFEQEGRLPAPLPKEQATPSVTPRVTPTV